MKTIMVQARLPVLAVVLLAFAGLSSAHALAAERDRPDRHPQPERHAGVGRHVKHDAAHPVERVEHGANYYRSPYWELDTRFHHNHYYPRHGIVVSALPPGYFAVAFGGGNFYFQGGVWFRSAGVNFVVTLPPPGIVIPVLPPAYTTLRIGAMPYYYANGVYYARAVSAPGYIVVEPPPGADSASLQTAPGAAPSAAANAAKIDAEPLFVYPRNGQKEAQVLKDRNECNRWATEQTSYDPAEDTADAVRNGNYRRAVSACLEGRGYTVR